MVEKRDLLDLGLIVFWLASWVALVYFFPTS